MENASDALIMAGQVLIFIVALSICIASFSTLRAGIDATMEQTETIQLAKNEDLYLNYLSSKNNNSVRVVGAETVVSSMYRAIKEDYVMYIKLKDYSNVRSIVNIRDANVDVEVDGNKIIKKDTDKIIEVTIGENKNQRVNALFTNGFYDEIKDMNFYEYLGEYQEDNNVTQENKQTKRVITYIQTEE